MKDEITVPLQKIRKVINTLKDQDDETPISFEYLCSALFPTIWQSVQDTISDSYTKGYIQGLNDSKGEKK